MSTYLLLAYVIFCGVPSGLALSITLRRRRVRRQIQALKDEQAPE